MTDAPGSISADCPLFSTVFNNDSPLQYFWNQASPHFSLYRDWGELQITFYELSDDSSLYLSGEPGLNYGYLYSHPGRQRRKAYRKVSIKVSFPIE
jgi:hypothetical protein